MSDIVNPDPQPWQRLPGESAAAYEAFRRYLDAGPNRTILIAFRAAPGKEDAPHAPGSYSRNAARFDWAERARAWDNYLQRERDKVRAQYIGLLEARAFESAEANFDLARELRKKVQQMLAMPLVKRTLHNGNVTVAPAKWRFADILRAAEAASSLEHASLEAFRPQDASLTDDERAAILSASHEAMSNALARVKKIDGSGNSASSMPE